MSGSGAGEEAHPRRSRVGGNPRSVAPLRGSPVRLWRKPATLCLEGRVDAILASPNATGQIPLQNEQRPRYLVTEPGVGYRLVTDYACPASGDGAAAERSTSNL
jgi:hypothetical protein